MSKQQFINMLLGRTPDYKCPKDYFTKVADVLMESAKRTGKLLSYPEMIDLYDYTLRKSDGRYDFGSEMFLVLLENEIDDFAMRSRINNFGGLAVNE